MEGFRRKAKINQQDVFLSCIQGRLKLLNDIVMKSHNTCTNQPASFLLF